MLTTDALVLASITTVIFLNSTCFACSCQWTDPYSPLKGSFLWVGSTKFTAQPKPKGHHKVADLYVL
jgi:hypothetical protein